MSGVLALMIDHTIMVNPCDRFFGTGLLFDIVIVAIVKSPSPLDLPDFCAAKIDAQCGGQRRVGGMHTTHYFVMVALSGSS